MPTKILDGLEATSPLHEGPPLEMSLIPPLQCLFCKHINPAGASFCNDCGSQLNLQPCGQCGAIDDRAAKHCYKCGADFTLPAAPGLEAPFAPAIPGTELTYPALNMANVAPEQTAPSVEETVSTDAGARPTGARRGMRMALSALVLALFAASVYLYNRPSAQLPPKQDLPRAAPAASPAPARIEPTPLQTGQRPQVVPSTRHSSGPAPVADSEAKSRQESAAVEDCPPAVATLGLCSPTPQQEGH